MADESGPLTERDLDELKDKLQALDKAEDVLRRAKNAGLDFSEVEKQARELRGQLTKIKNSFFPGR